MLKLISLASTFSLFLIGFAIAGCSGRPGSSASPANGIVHTNAFDNALPEIQSLWERATAATVSNDYAAAIITFRTLLERNDLTQEQRKAVKIKMAEASDELRVAVDKGYPNAKHALQQVRENRK